MSDIQAFPITIDSGQGVEWHMGMTLRDYFAARAMQLLGSEYTSNHGLQEGWTHALAHEAYWVADAMLKAREAK